MSIATSENPLRLLKLPEVLQCTRIGRTSLYAMIRRGEFPKPVNIGPRSVAWSSQEVEGWIAGRISESRCVMDAQ